VYCSSNRRQFGRWLLSDRESLFPSEPVLKSQEWKLDKAKAQPGDNYNVGKPNQEDHQAAKRKCVDRLKIVEIYTKEWRVGQVCAVGNPTEEDEGRKI